MNELERLEDFTKEYKALCLKFKLIIADHEIVDFENDEAWSPFMASIGENKYFNYDNEWVKV